MQLSAALSASSTTLVVGGIGLLSAYQSGQTGRWGAVLACALLAAAPFFLISLFKSLQAAQPREFNVVGNTLREWENDDDLYGSDLAASLVGQARVYQNQVDENIAILSRNAQRVTLALRTLLFSPLAALIGGVAASACIRI
jgi:hypothetical protein